MVPKIRDFINLHAMWFDVYSGDFFLFSQTAKRFMVINEENFDFLLKDMMTRIHITEEWGSWSSQCCCNDLFIGKYILSDSW